MAATVVIYEKNGAGGTTTDKTSGTVRFKNADNSTVDLVNPLVKPGTGFDYSYEKWLRAGVTGGSFSQITGLVAYTDGANGFGAGVEMFWKSVATYATPAEATGTTGYVDAFTYVSGTSLALNAGTVVGTGQMGDHLVAFVRINGTTVSGGLTASETATIAWSEI
ncbi:hypothetical protein UFOVP1672_14 [uncultured Caudovirales phage]|uniref:Uncharacterized protein n=1 Tax=uncultured Caudovirales phage TaxID=2100421 RepID=A0A6J5SAB5_9CAUD|nr:hypothetical protein UFOVP988_36 [uncultured Caudovirales phage]CAB4210734.1 hypothetical protein UFOVP1425_36 [uncultured Caudovirales phage]CAB4223298.1 hypothetical protein UFOVP1672_14 [uncultured Caudovirales phage]